EAIAQSHERVDPAGGAFKYPARGGRGVERALIDDQAIGVAHVRLRKQRAHGSVDWNGCHGQARLLRHHSAALVMTFRSRTAWARSVIKPITALPTTTARVNGAP